MATIKQIEKQLVSSNKKMDSLVKRVDMYRLRLRKAILSINKAGASLREEDIEMTETRRNGYVFREFHLPTGLVETYGFEVCYKVISNRECLDQAERDFDREKHRRDALSEELARMKSMNEDKEKVTLDLKVSLEKAMADFRMVWFDRMRQWYSSHYYRVREELPYAKDRYQRARVVMAYFTDKRGVLFFQKSPLYRMLTGIRKRAAEVIGDEAAKMDFDVYMGKKELELAASWSNGIAVFTEKCNRFALNESAIRVAIPQMTSKGFSALITDGGSRVVDVRVIWAAEYSELVTPHVRYIATQRML